MRLKEILTSSTLRNPILSISIIAQVCALALLWFGTAPMLEGFGVAVVQKYGSYADYFPGISGRPFSLVPQFLASTISGIDSFGYSIIAISLGLLRLFFLAKIFNRKSNTFLLLAPVALVAPPWTSISNERFLPAVTSFTLMIIAWYFFLKESKPRYNYILVAFLACLTYPPILLTALASYICVIILRIGTASKDKILNSDFLILLAPIFLYLMYLELQGRIFPSAYDSQFSSGLRLVNLLNIYLSFFTQYAMQSIALLSFILLFIFNKKVKPKITICRLLAISFIMLSSSAVYSQEFLHTNDPERIFFPPSVSLVLFGIFVAQKTFSSRVAPSFTTVSMLLISLVLISAQLSYWPTLASQNRHFLKSVEFIVSESDSIHSVQLRDATGRYGDVNTFFSTSLQSALTYTNPKFLKAEICTMRGRERMHPIAARYPLNTTVYCDKLDNSFDLYLEIVSNKPLRIKVLAQKNVS